jgi:hypothetical protein
MKSFIYWQICIIVAHLIVVIPMFIEYLRNKKIDKIIAKTRADNIVKFLNDSKSIE